MIVLVELSCRFYTHFDHLQIYCIFYIIRILHIHNIRGIDLALQATLAELEASLLATLSSATGNILDNAELIQTLEDAKGKSVEIAEKLAVAKVTSEEIEEVRVKYIPVAERGAILFFVMAGLSAISGMYEYSLAAFLTVFNQSLGNAKRDSLLASRLRNIIDTLTTDVYNYTCLGLFEKHKLLLSF